MLENSLSLSTAIYADDRPRRYISAAHAVDSYLEMRHLLSGCIGLDPERMAMMVQASPAPENPHLQRIDDIRLLERAFGVVRREVSDRDWGIWCKVRVEQKSYRQVKGVGRGTVGRVVELVDGLLEEELYSLGLLVRSAVRLEAQALRW